ncbi:Hypothetical protein PHPALM_36990 [Phytophthora palmivora]|uniref:Uncharacterized protein n=1 Tax=Phytophthora palmivora TaxID=4796 RepID=A0A2P4WYJ2_9STRA|nr:Hypothetical protein PHPALM_36990 [Phytophthora palmivora]
MGRRFNTKWCQRKGGVGKDNLTPGITKHPGRMTAIITGRGKLPIMFIIKGVPGGGIAKNEQIPFPPEHYYWVQSVGSLRVLDGRSIALLGNFDCHVFKGVTINCHTVTIAPLRWQVIV